jgi:hypothetical protein
MNQMYKLFLISLLLGSTAKAENIGNGTNTLAVQTIMNEMDASLSVEEKLYKLWQEAEGRQIGSNYNGTYVGLAVTNRLKDERQTNWPLYGTASLIFKNLEARMAMDIILTPFLQVAANAIFKREFNEIRLNERGIHDWAERGLYLRPDLEHTDKYVVAQIPTGTLVLNSEFSIYENTYYEYREIRPGVLVGLLPTQVNNSVDGYCPWSFAISEQVEVRPEIRDRRGRITQERTIDYKLIGWGNKRKSYKLPNTCDVHLIYMKKE